MTAFLSDGGRGSALRHGFSVVVVLGLLAGCQTTQPAAPPPEQSSIVTVREDFDFDKPGDAWKFHTPGLWRIALEDDRRFLQMAIPPERPPLPGPERPQEYALYGAYQFRSFALSCRVRIDREVSASGRDASIIFGRRDDTHFYYVDLCAGPGGGAIVRVDGQAREVLVQNPALAPLMSDSKWHKVDILRDVTMGRVQVYVDAYEAGLASPLLTATDSVYEWGHLGFGSVDDHASFTRIVIEGEARKR